MTKEELASKARMAAAGLVSANPPAGILAMAIKQSWRVECFGPDGRLKWVEEFDNLVVDVGLDEYLQRIYKSSSFTASDFVGLKDTGSIVAGDTMGSHSGWATITPYSNATDPAFTPGSVASESVDNSGSKAVLNINATDTIYGAFLKSDNTKGGTAGILLGGADFGASRGVGTGDTLNVTMTASLTSS